MVIKFAVEGEPFGKQRPRLNKNTGGIYTPKETVEYEALVALKAKSAMHGVSPMPKGKALRASIRAYASPPKSKSNVMKDNMLAGLVPMVKKPDIDNIVKAILDGCNGIVYEDDAQIIDLHVVKAWGETARVEVVFSDGKTEDIDR